MKWAPGRNKEGRVPLCSDNRPVFYVSECGRYTLAHAVVSRDGKPIALWSAWFRADPKESPVELNNTPVLTREEAATIAEGHKRAQPA